LGLSLIRYVSSSFKRLLFFLIGDGSPTFAAIIVSLIEYGKKVSEYLLDSLVEKFSKIWFLAPILLSFSIMVFSLGVLSMFAGVNYVNLQRLVVFVPVLISTFLQNMWEEIGWRRYALPKLQKYNAFYSSML